MTLLMCKKYLLKMLLRALNENLEIVFLNNLGTKSSVVLHRNPIAITVTQKSFQPTKKALLGACEVE